MKRFKNSSVLIDVVIIIAVLLAAVGFATVVHLNNINRPKNNIAHAELRNNYSSKDVLSEEVTDTSTSGDEGVETGNTVLSASAPASFEEATPLEATIPGDKLEKDPLEQARAATEQTVAKACDAAKKLAIYQEYDQSKAAEASRYQNDLNGITTGLLESAVKLKKELIETKHQQEIELLNSWLESQLQALDC